MSFLQKYIQSDGGVVRVINGIENGESAWFILKLSPESYSIYKKKINAGNLSVSKYGEILQCGWGDYPDDELLMQVIDG